jgi:tetratricopeptide (TPR) repeat protein
MASVSAPLKLSQSPEHPWSPPQWNVQNQAHLRTLLTAATKRLPNNAEAFFHSGLLHMRNANGEDALRAFQRARAIFDTRVQRFVNASVPVPVRLTQSLACLRAHTAQAAHLAAASKLSREERAPLLDRLQSDLVASTQEDSTRPDVWNALALLHLGEGGFSGAREILLSICEAFPDYLDALNNLGLAELALGNEHAAVACFQKVVLTDVRHTEALSNYGLVLLRNGVYEAAARTFRAAVDGAGADGFGLAFAWGGLAIAEAATGNMEEAENAATAAEASADSVTQSRFSLLLGCIRTRRVSDALHRCVISFDSRPSVVVASDQRHSAGATDDEDEYAAGILAPQEPIDTGHMPGHELRDILKDPRHAIESTVSLLRGVARDVRSSLSSSALGAALRVRHDYLWEETGNRNYGSESAERLVESLEADGGDATVWVQLALLQLGAGEYESSRDFCTQAVARAPSLGAGWNALAVSFQLNSELSDALVAYEKAITATIASCNEQQNSSHLHCNSDAAPPVNSTIPGLTLNGVLDPATEVPCAADDPLVDAPSSGHQDDIDEPQLNRPGLVALAAVYNNLGNAKRQDGSNLAEAQKAYEKSLRLGGESAAVYNNLALLYIAMDRLDDAEKTFLHALSIAPFFDAAVSNLLKLRRVLSERMPTPKDDEIGSTHNDEVDSS